MKSAQLVKIAMAGLMLGSDAQSGGGLRPERQDAEELWEVA